MGRTRRKEQKVKEPKNYPSYGKISPKSSIQNYGTPSMIDTARERTKNRPSYVNMD